MASTMTPSTMTDGQIDKAVEAFAGKLRKYLRNHKSELSSEAVQIVLGQDDLIDEQFNLFRKRAEAVSNMIVRRVKVDRSLEPEAMLEATGRKQYTDKKVVKNMPKGSGPEADVYFFKVGSGLSDEELEKECALRGLVPADPYSQAAVNRDDNAFADEHPNGTHWKDADGKWCLATFYRWFVDVRGLDVDRSGCVWNVDWWFAGLRK